MGDKTLKLAPAESRVSPFGRMTLLLPLIFAFSAHPWAGLSASARAAEPEVAEIATTEATGQSAGTAWLGVLVRDAVDGGVQVVAVVPGGPASRVRLRDGDLLLTVNGEQLVGPDALGTALREVRPGEAVRVEVLRDGERLRREVLAAPRPFQVQRSQTPIRELAVAGLRLPPGESGLLGARVEGITPELRRHYGAPEGAGVLVTRVREGSLSGRAGVEVGDVLVKVGEQLVEREGDLQTSRWIQQAVQGSLELHVIRGGKPRSLSAEVVAAYPGATGSVPVERSRLRQRIERTRSELNSIRRRSAALEAELKRLEDALAASENASSASEDAPN
ncbi:hypothetical protein ABI59_02710 [Acidobacteria bacterium Mor1]|nr:hypothetical protein ABI59_02710 [Acidobacteria bacterium Mor1]